jgi:thioredoxin-related protein
MTIDRLHACLFAAISGWLLAWSAAVMAGPPAGYAFVSYDEGLRAARAQQKRLFVYFGREGCAWCEKTNKQAFGDAGVRRLYHDHYVLVYVDTESGKRLTLPSGERVTEMELGTRFRVFATPVFAWLEPDGRAIAKVAGVQTVKDFSDYDRFVHDGIYRDKEFREFLGEIK